METSNYNIYKYNYKYEINTDDYYGERFILATYDKNLSPKKELIKPYDQNGKRVLISLELGNMDIKNDQSIIDFCKKYGLLFSDIKGENRLCLTLFKSYATIFKIILNLQNALSKPDFQLREIVEYILILSLSTHKDIIHYDLFTEKTYKYTSIQLISDFINYYQRIIGDLFRAIDNDEDLDFSQNTSPYNAKNINRNNLLHQRWYRPNGSYLNSLNYIILPFTKHKEININQVMYNFLQDEKIYYEDPKSEYFIAPCCLYDFLYELFVTYENKVEIQDDYSIKFTNKLNFPDKYSDKRRVKKTAYQLMCDITNEYSQNVNTIAYVPDGNSLHISSQFNSDSLIDILFWELKCIISGQITFYKCEAHNCNNFFYRSPNDQRQKYCSTSCKNRVAQKNYRKKHKFD